MIEMKTALPICPEDTSRVAAGIGERSDPTAANMTFSTQVND